MPATSPDHADDPVDNIEEALQTRGRRVLNLLHRAGQDGIILFLTYNYETTRRRVETYLTTQMAASNLQPVPIDLRREKALEGDLVSLLLERAGPAGKVLMVTGIGGLGMPAYRSLNYQRERLVEGQVKVVFWLTGEEVRSLATGAPDFWAWKHRIIDFPEKAGDEGVRDVYQAATAFMSQTRFESAEELAGMIATREAILNALPAKNRTERRETLVALGSLYYDSGRYADAEAALINALKLIRGPKQAALEASITIDLGAVAGDQGKLNQAQDYYSRSLEISERLGNQQAIARTLHGLGTLAHEKGRVGEARNYYSKSLEIKKHLEDRQGIAATLHQLGMLAQEWGRVDEAHAYYDKSLELRKQLGDRRGIGHTLYQLGLLSQNQGRVDEAHSNYGQSLEIAVRLGYQPGIAATLHQLGNLDEDEGRLDDAADKFLRALNIFEQLNSPQAETARNSLRDVQDLIRQKNAQSPET